LARLQGVAAVAYGVNSDDTTRFPPAIRAATEHQVLAPLLDARTAQSGDSASLAARRTADAGTGRLALSRLPACLTGTEVTTERSRWWNVAKPLSANSASANSASGSMTICACRIAPDEMPRAYPPQMSATIADV